jgi:hypothetical protein
MDEVPWYEYQSGCHACTPTETLCDAELLVSNSREGLARELENESNPGSTSVCIIAQSARHTRHTKPSLHPRPLSLLGQLGIPGTLL